MADQNFIKREIERNATFKTPSANVPFTSEIISLKISFLIVYTTFFYIISKRNNKDLIYFYLSFQIFFLKLNQLPGILELNNLNLGNNKPHQITKSQISNDKTTPQ